jgi:hypothetical protein
MTSANVVEYRILKDGKEVGHHRQNIMCRRCNDKLLEFTPPKDFTIQAYGYDEEEDYWEDENQYNLEEWLNKNPAEITFKQFQIGEVVRLYKQRCSATIVEQLKGKFDHEYVVELENTERIIVTQSQIKPITK